MLVGAMSSCPCGYFGDPTRECTCSRGMVDKYHKRISGPLPLLDRIDIHVEAPREKQTARFAGTSLRTNADMGPAHVRRFCELDAAGGGGGFIKTAMRQLGLSARAYHRVLKLARTIADLAASEAIEAQHLAEALQYRQRQRE